MLVIWPVFVALCARGTTIPKAVTCTTAQPDRNGLICSGWTESFKANCLTENWTGLDWTGLNRDGLESVLDC